VAMTKTLRKRRGARFIYSNRMHRMDRNQNRILLHILSIVFEFQLTVDGRGNDHRDSDNDRTNDDSERDILIVLDLFFY